MGGEAHMGGVTLPQSSLGTPGVSRLECTHFLAFASHKLRGAPAAAELADDGTDPHSHGY